jgi:hypothetical protein
MDRNPTTFRRLIVKNVIREKIKQFVCKKNLICSWLSLGKWSFLFLGTVVSTAALAQVHVRGYYTSKGTYVAPHIRSSPDSVKWNNYGRGIQSNNSPYARDYDRDGIPNINDFDDDNDGINDDQDY